MAYQHVYSQHQLPSGKCLEKQWKITMLLMGSHQLFLWPYSIAR